MFDRDPRNSSRQSSRCMPVATVALRTTQVTVRFVARFHPNFEGEHLGGGQELPTYFHLPPTSPTPPTAVSVTNHSNRWALI
ncbi:hypothetical protein TNCV_4898151 [Trichonephila clavipes]|nr:hypothetical protein TNCV_4898151 [Trichonephila clavipes]